MTSCRGRICTHVWIKSLPIGDEMDKEQRPVTIVSSGYALQENSLYQTEPFGTLTLLRHLPDVSGWRIWECAAGNHLMADVLREAGARVLTSDIAVYDHPHDYMIDFLKDPAPLGRIDAIFTNPPYGASNLTARKFCERALERCAGWVAMLMTDGFDCGSTRTHLFRDNPRFHAKISFLDRLMWFPGPDAKTGTGDHAWFVWRPTSEECRPAQMYWASRADVARMEECA